MQLPENDDLQERLLPEPVYGCVTKSGQTRVFHRLFFGKLLVVANQIGSSVPVYISDGDGIRRCPEHPLRHRHHLNYLSLHHNHKDSIAQFQ